MRGVRKYCSILVGYRSRATTTFLISVNNAEFVSVTRREPYHCVNQSEYTNIIRKERQETHLRDYFNALYTAIIIDNINITIGIPEHESNKVRIASTNRWKMSSPQTSR